MKGTNNLLIVKCQQCLKTKLTTFLRMASYSQIDIIYGSWQVKYFLVQLAFGFFALDTVQSAFVNRFIDFRAVFCSSGEVMFVVRSMRGNGRRYEGRIFVWVYGIQYIYANLPMTQMENVMHYTRPFILKIKRSYKLRRAILPVYQRLYSRSDNPSQASSRVIRLIIHTAIFFETSVRSDERISLISLSSYFKG